MSSAAHSHLTRGIRGSLDSLWDRGDATIKHRWTITGLADQHDNQHAAARCGKSALNIP